MNKLNTQYGEKNLRARPGKKQTKTSATKYKYVRKHTHTSTGSETYVAKMNKHNNNGFSWTKTLPVTEENLIKLAKMVDIKLIKSGKSPVNVLKKQ